MSKDSKIRIEIDLMVKNMLDGYSPEYALQVYLERIQEDELLKERGLLFHLKVYGRAFDRAANIIASQFRDGSLSRTERNEYSLKARGESSRDKSHRDEYVSIYEDALSKMKSRGKAFAHTISMMGIESLDLNSREYKSVMRVHEESRNRRFWKK